MLDVRRLTGQKFRGFELGAVLGEGADGIVYVAKNKSAAVAIKFFFRDALERNGIDEGMERLELQLQLRGKKFHPNLVEIIDGGFSEEVNTLYILMEYVDGKSLDSVIQEVPTDSIPPLLTQLASAAEFLHLQGLVHRDIKPANIVVSHDFSKLTLLDLGVVLTVLGEGEQRLSGDKFVATTRYSPPEFVWRTEDTTDKDAWTAITFYQIGATLHDLIMRRILFTGHDQPHARLYDSVKYRSPEFVENGCAPWLLAVAKCCLFKNWRDRLALLTWDSFRGPVDTQTELEQHTKTVRVKQIRNQERLAMQDAEKIKVPQETRASQLWNLQNGVFLEVREYLIKNNIFPKFSVMQQTKSEKSYLIEFRFEEDRTLGFDESLQIIVLLYVSEFSEQSTTMEISAVTATKSDLLAAKWIEMLSIESAVKICQGALMNVVDQLIPD